MKTILYLSKFKKKDSDEYQSQLDIEPDEIVMWDGDRLSLPCKVPSLPCLLVDPEDEIVEKFYIDPETQEEKTYFERELNIDPIVFEHRKKEN